MARRDRFMDEIFAEIEGTSSVSVKPSPKLKKKFVNPKVRKKSFLSLCAKRETLLEERDEIDNSLGRIEGELEALTQLNGIPVGRDRIVYYHPFKSHLIFRQRGLPNFGEILQWANEHRPDLVNLNVTETLDVQMVRHLIQNKTLPTQAQALLDQLLKLVRESGVPGVVKRLTEEELDLDRFNEAKAKNEIPANILKLEQDSIQGTYSFRIDHLDDRPRCPKCGENVPKRNKKGQVCKRCSHPLSDGGDV